MRFLLLPGLLLATLLPAFAALVGKTVNYSDEQGTALEGYVVYDDAISGTRPGVVVVHDWRGITDETKRRADMLARLGYIAFAADVYGKGVRPQSVPEYGKQAGKYKGDRALFRERERAAYQELLKQPQVDPTRVAAIGYCFGGTGVIEMARDGLDLKGVVTFHGGLDAQPLSPGATIKAKVLALCGADDPFEKPGDMKAFEQQLRENNVDYQIVFYGHAVHAFTDPGVDALNLPGAKYNAAADKRSWQAMQDFFAEIFAKS
ncbi:MAG TPA: dienelactone hydrolase family protein [Candidatus Methylacidiphilales bacterium]|jgi:dienelactone hydrolase|nr:dienelactone hydrolase family protein [Candidatus Methylacidiphilales bacterium]